MKKLLLVALACTGVVPLGRAQTGRIAHFSHGGSVGGVRAEEERDNFGIPYIFVAREIKRISDSTATMRGYVTHDGRKIESSAPVEQSVQFATRNPKPEPYGVDGRLYSYYRVIEPLSYLRAQYPQAIFIGFDQQKVKKHTKKSITGAVGKLSFPHDSVGLSGAVLLAGLDWLWGRRTKQLTIG